MPTTPSSTSGKLAPNNARSARGRYRAHIHADQARAVLDGEVRKAATADDVLRQKAPVLRRGAKSGLRAWATAELRRDVEWLRRRIRRVRPSDAAGNVYLELARELGDLAPKGAKGGKHGTEVYWAHDLRGRARALLAGKDAARPKKKAAAPKKRASSPSRLPPKKRAKPVKKPSGRRR